MTDPTAETRYGAFRAMRALRPSDDSVRGELLNEAFWVHHAAPASPSLVHVSSTRRAEIVLFGEEIYLEPPFSFRAGPEFTITAGNDDTRCTLSCFSLQDGIHRKQCSLKLDEVLHKLAEMGAAYPDVVDMLRRRRRPLPELPRRGGCAALGDLGRRSGQRRTGKQEDRFRRPALRRQGSARRPERVRRNADAVRRRSPAGGRAARAGGGRTTAVSVSFANEIPFGYFRLRLSGLTLPLSRKRKGRAGSYFVAIPSTSPALIR